jgi:GR25 family glycosyltransferase involved in LPS biosynthesis
MLTFIIHNPGSGRKIDELRKAVLEAHVLPAIMVSGDPHFGCALSHQKAISLAVEANAPCVWVLEDDCKFTSAFSLDRWGQHVETLLTSPFDLLHGGVLKLSGAGRTLDDPGRPSVFAEGLVAGGQNWSSHCVVYKQSAFWPLLKPCAPSPEFGMSGLPIDIRPGALGLKTLVTVPFMATQHAGESAVGRAYFDYSSEFAVAEQYLLNVDNFDDIEAYMRTVREPYTILMTPFEKLNKQSKVRVNLGKPFKFQLNGKDIVVPEGPCMVPSGIAEHLKQHRLI